MAKRYEVQFKFGSSWVTVETTNLQADAMTYVREHGSETYPIRIQRVVKTTVFEDKKQ